MSIHERTAKIATESVESTDGPRVFDSPAEFRATREVGYGELVSRVASERDLSAADAKEYIALEGRAAVLRGLSE